MIICNKKGRLSFSLKLYFISALLIIASAGQTPSELVPREKILQLAYASPEMVFEHRKEDWIELFDPQAILVDPEGSWEAKG